MHTSPPRPFPKAEPAEALRPTLGLLPVLAMTAIAAAGPVLAQEAAVELETLVVEGKQTNTSATSYAVAEGASQKYTAPLLDTPKTVTVITQRQMEERGATSLTDVLRTTPGVTLGAGEGGTPMGDRPYVRGFEASQDIMVDGMRNASRTSYEAFNLESVEIAKGPGGAYAGAGSTGGTISLNTKTPQPGAFDIGTLSLGTGNFIRGTFDSNREFGDLGVRLNIMSQHADDLGGRDGVTSDRFGIAPSVSYKLNEATKVTAGLYYLKNEDMPDYGVPMSNANTPAEYRRGTGSWNDPFEPADLPTDTFYGLKARDFREAESASGYAKIEHSLGNGLELTSTLRQTRDTNTYVTTAPTSGTDGLVNRASKASDRVNETTAFNTQITGQTEFLGTAHSFAIGVDIANSKATTRGLTVNNPTPFSVGFGDADVNDPWGGTLVYGNDTGYHTTKSRGIYAFDTVKFAPQWEAALGLRYDYYDVSSNAYSNQTAEWVAGQNTSEFVNGLAGLVYKPAENASIYVSISTSSNPSGEGAGNGGTAASDSLNELDPERSTSYELGTKWALFDDQLTLSAALFKTEKDNARVTNADGDTENIGKTRAQGIELGVAGQIDAKWGIAAGYVYQDVKLVDGGYSTMGGVTTPNSATGKQVTKVPRNSLSLWTTYQYDDQWTFGGGLTYLDKRWASYSNGTATGANYALPASWRTDLMATYKLSQDTQVQLNINNIFDKQIYTDSHFSQFVNVEPGRNFVVSLRHAF